MIALHAWPGGLAIVVEAQAQHAAAVFGPDGWRRGDPRVVLPDGLPSGAESATLQLPPWLLDQLPALEIGLGGVHTEFVRLDRLLTRMQGEGRDGVVVVLGRQPAAVVLAGGRPHMIEPTVPAGAPAMPILASASGWIVVFSGRVALHAPAPARAPAADVVPASTAMVVPEIAVETAAQSAPPRVPAPPAPVTPPEPDARPIPPSVADERFVVASSLAREIPDDVADEVKATAGEPALEVVAQLDGSRSVADIAASTGLTVAQVAAVVKVLASRKLAFKYVSRVRPSTGVRTSG